MRYSGNNPECNESFYSPAATFAKNYAMSHFTNSAPILFIFIYIYIICNHQLLLQQFSALKTHKKPWKSTKFQICPTTAQVSPKNSLPLTTFSTQNNCQPIQKLIIHQQIILYSSNSFAILSIPFPKFKIMNCPTSPKQKKRQQKALQSQGKLLIEPLNSHMLSPIHNHMEESLAFPKNLNRMAPQEPTRIPIQNSLPPKQRQSNEQPNQQSDLSPQTNSSTKWHPTATQELLRILSQNSQPQQKSPPKEIPNPQINSFSTNTTLQINLVFANTNSKPTTNSPSNTIQIKQINSSMTNKKSPLDIFYPIPMQSPTWPSLQEANNMSTHQHKKPKICKSDQLIPSHATNNHLQTIPTSTSQQNRSQKEIGKTCNEQSNKHRTRTAALPALQADCPQTSPQLNRKSNPGKHSHTPKILTIHIPSNTNHMAEYSGSLLNANHITTPHPQLPLQTNRTQEQGKPPHNITNPTTPASSINNQIEEHTVPPSPPPHSINRHKGHRNKPALPAPQADCPLPHPHPNRHNNPAQGKYTQNNTELTTPASSINNQIEEYPVSPSSSHPTTEQARPIASEPSPEEPHPQPNQTPTSPQNRSPPETAKDRKKKRKEYRNQPALPALQADNSLPRPHITRNNDQATLLNAAHATPNTSHHQAQGNPLPNNTQLSMSASPINNQIEEYTVPPPHKPRQPPNRRCCQLLK
jgi:hypothetical protein